MGNHTAPAAWPASEKRFTRAFLLLGALWLVAQAHRGSFLAAWADEANVPGNVCWLLILYCLARMLLDWGVRSVRLWRFSRDALFLIACMLAIELLWRVLASETLGLAAFFVQPVMVILGFAALHRQTARPIDP
jgi:hypothetical protein